MTKLEEKLIELGYKTYNDPSDHKHICRYFNGRKRIVINCARNKINKAHVDTYCIRTQNDMFKLQKLFNSLQKDLEILSLC